MATVLGSAYTNHGRARLSMEANLPRPHRQVWLLGPPPLQAPPQQQRQSVGRNKGGTSLHLGSQYLGSLRCPWPLSPVHAAPRGCWRRRRWGAARCPAWPGCGKSGGAKGRRQVTEALRTAPPAARNASPPPSWPGPSSMSQLRGPLCQEALPDPCPGWSDAPLSLQPLGFPSQPHPLWVICLGTGLSPSPDCEP